MSKSMFCPKCGTADQTAESYCTRCGEWLPDLDARAGAVLFRKRSREERIKKIRALEAVSAGLSLTSAAIIIGFLSTGRNGELLFLAAFCALLVAVYQAINFYLGYTLQHRIDRSRKESNVQIPSPNETRKLESADLNQFPGAPSVIENTTDLLEPIPRQARHDQKKK